MKLISYLKEGHEQLAILVNDFVYDTDVLHPELPSSMSMILNYWDDYLPLAMAMDQSIKEGKISPGRGIPLEGTALLPPVTQPASFRQAYAFNRNFEVVRKDREDENLIGIGQFPVFQFGNHHSMQGPGAVQCMPDHLEELDFGLQLAIVISKFGRNITADRADEYIGGYILMNTLCARRLQMEGLTSPLSQAKGTDFATLTGPWLVTPDEMEAFKLEPAPGRQGNNYNLWMKCLVNNELICETSSSGMDWSFAEIIERCSYGADIYPGDIIGSGTAVNGSFFELNSSEKVKSPESEDRWLREGDIVEVEMQLLGKLSTTIIAEESEHRLMK